MLQPDKKQWAKTLNNLWGEPPFQWKGGATRCTEGIWILKKPIMITVPEHSKQVSKTSNNRGNLKIVNLNKLLFFGLRLTRSYFVML